MRLIPILALLAAFSIPFAASAQSQLPTSEAQSFLGSWTLAMQSDMGPVEFGLNLRDADGRVAAQMQSPMGNVDITNVRRSGDNLVLEYSMDMQGQSLPISLTLRPDGDATRAAMDFAGGMFTLTGTATRSN